MLDGVRAIACLSVLTFHLQLIAYSNLHLWNFSIGTLLSSIIMTGSAGVTLFFILSGFLLFLPYAKALLYEGHWPSTRQFYLKRALRILPGYYTALFLLILLTQPQYLQPGHLPQLGLFVSFFMDSTQQTYQQINGPFWTLAVEWQFYLLLPWLALGFRWLVMRTTSKKRWWTLLCCLLGLVAWGLFSRAFGLYFSAHPTESVLMPRPALNIVLFFIYGTSGKYLEDFAVGMLLCFCYVLSRQAASDHPLSIRLKRASYWLWGCGLLWLLFASLWHFNNWIHKDTSLFFLDPISKSYDLLGELSLSVGFGLCMLPLLFGPVELKRVFAWRPLRWIGLISYSLYIWHLPLLEDFKEHLKGLQGLLPPSVLYLLLWACALLIVIPFSYAVYKWIESPWIRMADRMRKMYK